MYELYDAKGTAAEPPSEEKLRELELVARKAIEASLKLAEGREVA